MPSFFEGMKRMLSGQPVYRDDEEDGVIHKSDQQQAQQPPVQQAQPAPAKPRVIPEVTITRFEVHPKDPARMLVVVALKNHSPDQVALEQISILGTVWKLNKHPLKPNEEREFTVYEGPRPNHTGFTHAEVHYRDEADPDPSRQEYYAADHYVHFDQQADGTYTPRKADFHHPVRNISQ